jgi:hypothetical protein
MSRAQRPALFVAAVALAASGLACATSTRVGIDDRADFSSFRSWDWHGRVAPLVGGQHVAGRDLDALLGQLIQRSLASRGYRHSHRSPDFFVTYDFALRRRSRVEQVAHAPYLLSSLHASPSFRIEGGETTYRVYRQLKLAVAVTDAGGKVVWKGVLQREFEEYQNPGLADAVASVLARFPKASPHAPDRWAVAGN